MPDCLADEIRMCDRCRLSRKTKVVGDGPIPAQIMLIGEAPGQEEDAKGLPFVGPSGILIREALKDAGIADITYITNMIKCRPPNNRPPDDSEILDCRPWLYKQIAEINPAGLLLCGTTAASLIIPDHKPGEWVFVYRTFLLDKHAITLYHPSYMLRRGVTTHNKNGSDLYAKTVFNMKRLHTIILRQASRGRR